MAVAKRQRKEKSHKIGTKRKSADSELKPHVKQTAFPASLALHRAGSGGGDKTYKKRKPRGLMPPCGWPTVTRQGCTILCLPDKNVSCN